MIKWLNKTITDKFVKHFNRVSCKRTKMIACNNQQWSIPIDESIVDDYYRQPTKIENSTSFFIDFYRLFKFDSRFYRFSNQKEFRKRILGSLLNKSQCKISRIMVRQRTRKIYFDSFDAPWSERSWVNLVGEDTQNPFWGFGTFSWSDQKWELLSWLTANPVLSTTRIFLCIFHTHSIPGVRSFPSIALRIPTAHNFTRD